MDGSWDRDGDSSSSDGEGDSGGGLWAYPNQTWAETYMNFFFNKRSPYDPFFDK